MLTKNYRHPAATAIIMTALCFCLSPMALAAQVAPQVVAKLSTGAGIQMNSQPVEQTYLQAVASEIQALVNRELSTAERKNLAGAAATIDVTYNDHGTFETANVVSADMNKLATTIHRKMVWKSCPLREHEVMEQPTARIKVHIDQKGSVLLNLETI